MVLAGRNSEESEALRDAYSVMARDSRRQRHLERNLRELLGPLAELGRNASQRGSEWMLRRGSPPGGGEARVVRCGRLVEPLERAVRLAAEGVDEATSRERRSPYFAMSAARAASESALRPSAWCAMGRPIIRNGSFTPSGSPRALLPHRVSRAATRRAQVTSARPRFRSGRRVSEPIAWSYRPASSRASRD